MTVQTPIPDFEAAREAMVESQLRPQGVNAPEVVAAMGKVPRELFVPDAVRPLAYIDRFVPLGDGRYMMPPAALGLILTEMAPMPGERALVVGGATGYSAAVLRQMGVEPIVLETSAELAARAAEQGLIAVEGPLEQGLKRRGPYDLLLVDGAVELIPETFGAQLKDGGRLGAAVIDRGITRLVLGRKAGSTLGITSIVDAAVPALPGFQRPRAFTF